MKTRHTITTQTELRAAFWAAHPGIDCRRGMNRRPLPQNQQHADTRAAFVAYVDAMTRAGEISETLADRVTL